MFIESLESRSLLSRPLWGNLGDYLHDWMQAHNLGDFPNPKAHSPYWEGDTHMPPTTQPSPTTQPTKE